MTLPEVAGLVGVSHQYLSMIERGLKPLDRRSMISALAAALRVSETELTGGPHLGADPIQSGAHAAVPVLRQALEASSLDDVPVDHGRPVPELANLVTGCVEPSRAEGDLAQAGDLLPAIMEELYWQAAEPRDEKARKAALETLVEACFSAGLIAKDLGYADLAYVAVLRATQAADALSDPVARGKADVLRLFAFPRERPSWDRRLA